MNSWQTAKNVLADIKTAYDWQVCGGLCDADTAGIMHNSGNIRAYVEFSWNREAFFGWVVCGGANLYDGAPLAVRGVTDAADWQEAVDLVENAIRFLTVTN